MNSKYLVGVRHKESGSVRGLVVCEDPKFVVNDIRASIRSTPNCAYAMFPDDYEIVVKEVDCVSFDCCVACGE